MNKRIIVIDDEESILDDYRMILSPPQKDLAAIEEKASLEAELFGESSGWEPVCHEFYEVTTVKQGKDGFEKIKEARSCRMPFALAFVDIRMPPGWDGIRTARAIREIDKEIEIVIVTAYSDRERREIIQKVGMPERLLYLKKPFDPDEIRQLALALTRKWELERKAERHKEYLEQLLESVRRLKTLSITSIKDVLSAILREVLHFVDGRKGLVAKIHGETVCVELTTEELSPVEVARIVSRMKRIAGQASGLSSITWMDGVMVMPLKDLSGSLFILALDIQPPVRGEELDLLKLLLETASEVLMGFRKQEQLMKSEKVATIGQLAAGVFHEISSPLTAISGTVEMCVLEKRKLWRFLEEYQELVEEACLPAEILSRFRSLNELYRIGKAAERFQLYEGIMAKGFDRIHALMKNIRGFSRIKEDISPELQDISEAIEDTLTLVHGALKADILVHRNWEKPLIAWCDADGLKQVLLNLILNAVQAMQGSGELWISGKCDNGRVMLSVKDTGTGLPPEMQERIFDAFYTTKPDGMGLGLSIVRGIIDKHKGSIRVESEPGRGTVFHIELPTCAEPERYFHENKIA